METISLQKLLFSILTITTLFFFFFFPLLLQAKDDDYTRHPPGKLLNPHHDRSESEPEQVDPSRSLLNYLSLFFVQSLFSRSFFNIFFILSNILGTYFSCGKTPHESFMGDSGQTLPINCRIRHRTWEIRHQSHRRPHVVQVLLLQLRRDPPR